jgi:hypothetical protein
MRSRYRLARARRTKSESSSPGSRLSARSKLGERALASDLLDQREPRRTHAYLQITGAGLRSDLQALPAMSRPCAAPAPSARGDRDRESQRKRQTRHLPSASSRASNAELALEDEARAGHTVSGAVKRTTTRSMGSAGAAGAAARRQAARGARPRQRPRERATRRPESDAGKQHRQLRRG